VPTGKVKWYDVDKGFGFIAVDGGGEDVFVPRSALPDGVASLKQGTRLEFGVAEGRKGAQALQVRVLDTPPSVSKALRKRPADMVPIIEDLYRLLESVEKSYRASRHPEPRTARSTAKVLRALADELER
jgi:CspA family cold shock protein